MLIIANSTPIFQWISTPFAWLLELMRIPEAQKVAPAFVLSFADQFLAGVVGSSMTTDAAKFMCAGISGTGLIYMTEVGVLIMNSSIPLNFLQLAAIYLVRAVLQRIPSCSLRLVVLYVGKPPNKAFKGEKGIPNFTGRPSLFSFLGRYLSGSGDNV